LNSQEGGIILADLFNKKILNKHLQRYSIENKEDKMSRVKRWKQNLRKNKGINEEQLQGAFLNGIFGIILNYTDVTNAVDDRYTMKTEPSTEVDATKPDGSLGLFINNGKHRTKAVIELKGPDKSLDNKQKRSGKDYGTPVEQAFNYATKYDGCKWVIVSNMIEIRLYKYTRGQGHYEEFLIPELDQEENFKKFALLLSQENLINKNEKSLTEKLSEETVTHEEDISTKFYNLYKTMRIELFEHLKANNEAYDSTFLLEKAQKFLDRIIFICFCEDLGLLPTETLHSAIERGKSSFVPDETEIWKQMRGVFKSIDKGNPEHNINAYNGGLFKYDESLDGLTIKNEFFEEIDEIAAYNFDSELDVNILGHIFEQSINDIEEIKANIKDEEYNEENSKRKKNGIFYTPEYITKYIVENSIGQYLEDIKEELGYNELPDINDASNPQVEGKYKKQHFNFYDEYENKLKDIKVIDPACGSGAFLNQAFDYLLKEHKWIQRQRALIEEGQMNIYSSEGLLKQILQDNIYGVDLNEESVEITKLSLWLKTANKNRPLANLDDNIKCGNSLIDDPEVAGDKAFDWNEEFDEIMKDGGFDIVIGNPPYGAELKEKEKNFFYNNYSVSEYQLNSYVLFFETALNILNKNRYLGFIVPNTFLLMNYFKDLRKFILENSIIKDVVAFEFPVFKDAVVDTIIMTLQKSKKSKKNELFFPVKIVEQDNKLFDFNKLENKHYSNMNLFNQNERFEFNIYIDSDTQKILNKLEKYFKLKEKCEVTVGIKPYETGKGTPPQTRKDVKNRVYDSNHKKNNNYRQYLVGRNINRYIITPNKNNWIKYGKCLAAPRPSAPFEEKEKILVRQTADSLICALDENKFITLNNVHNIKINDQENLFYKYLLGYLNSSLLNFYLQSTVQEKGETFAEVKATHLKNLPLFIADKKTQRRINNLVNTILNKKQKLFSNNNIKYIDLINKYTSTNGPTLSEIVEQDGFYNKIYSGRARKVRTMTVTINDNILTLYADKSSSGKYEIIKFEVDDKYERQYIKLFLENFTEEQLEVADEFSGSLPKKILQIEIPDYNKLTVIRKVVNEWNKLQNEITVLEEKIEKNDNEIDQMVYNLYDLTDEDIKIVEENSN